MCRQGAKVNLVWGRQTCGCWDRLKNNKPSRQHRTYLCSSSSSSIGTFPEEIEIAGDYKQQSLKTQPDICSLLEIDILHLTEALLDLRARDTTVPVRSKLWHFQLVSSFRSLVSCFFEGELFDGERPPSTYRGRGGKMWPVRRRFLVSNGSCLRWLIAGSPNTHTRTHIQRGWS